MILENYVLRFFNFQFIMMFQDYKVFKNVERGLVLQVFYVLKVKEFFYINIGKLIVFFKFMYIWRLILVSVVFLFFEICSWVSIFVLVFKLYVENDRFYFYIFFFVCCSNIMAFNFNDIVQLLNLRSLVSLVIKLELRFFK